MRSVGGMGNTDVLAYRCIIPRVIDWAIAVSFILLRGKDKAIT